MSQPINQQIQQPINQPSKPQTSGAPGGRNQKDRRYMDTFWDVHRSARFPNGRPWCGPREIAANRDTTPVPHDGFVIPDLMQGEYVEDDNGFPDRAATLRAVWSAPWKPLSKYFVFHYPKKRIRFDYPKFRLDEEAEMRKYYQAAAKLGSKLNIRVQFGVEPDFQIVADLGSALSYIHNITIAEAAIAGDPWLLGHIDEPNMDLAEILGFTDRGLKVTSFEPVAKPDPVVVERVIAQPDDQMTQLIDMLREQNALLHQQVDALKQKRAEKGEQLRAGKKTKGPTATQAPAEQPAA